MILELDLEFLYFSTGSVDDQTAVDLFNGKRVSHRRAEAAVRAATGSIVTNAKMAARCDRQYWFMGSVFAGGGFFNNFGSMDEADIVRLCELARDDPATTTGTFMSIVSNGETGQTDFVPDDMNAAPCFHARAGAAHAVSNNPHILAGWLTAQGRRPTRSIDPFLSSSVFGSGLTVGSLYDGVETVKPETRLRARRDGIEICPHDPVWPGLLSMSYDELIDASAQRIRTRMEILTNAPGNVSRVFDLTGGMDSRMILAALVGSGAIDQWSFNTLFEAPNPDGNFARHVAERWGLRRMLLAAMPLPRRPGLWAETRTQLFHSFGTENKRGYFPNFYQPNLLRVHGGFGELGGKNQDTKRFTKTPPGSDSFTSYVTTYLQAVARETEQVDFTADVLAWAEAHLGPEIEASMSAQVPEDLMPAVFYRRGKARSHYGMISHLRSLRLQYPDVLNDPYLTAAALKIGPEKSRFGKVNFDVIRKLGGDEIAAMPLVLARWNRQIFENWDDVKKFSKPPIQASSEPMFKQPCETVTAPGYLEEATLDEIWAPEPDDRIHLGRAVPRKALIGNLCIVARRLLDDAPMSDEVARFMSRKAVDTVVNADPHELVPNTANLNVVRFFIETEMWLRGLEQPYYAA